MDGIDTKIKYKSLLLTQETRSVIQSMYFTALWTTDDGFQIMSDVYLESES